MTTIVYVSNADSGEISVLRLDLATGALTALQRFETGARVMPLAIGGDRRFLYASLREEPARVLSCGIDAANGRLTRLHEAPLPASACHICVDRSGHWLLSASYGGHCIGVNAIDDQGRAHGPQQVLVTAPNAHALRTDLTNRFAFATCLGGSVVMQMHFDAASGSLTPNAVPNLSVRGGAGPRHLEFHPQGDIVYLLNELDATIDTLALDRTTGTLRPVQSIAMLPAGFAGEPWGADLHIRPDGRYLYASERRTSTLSIFRIDPQRRELHLLDQVATEALPRGFNIDRSGRWLFAAGQLSNRVGVYAIDPMGGMLRPVGSLPVGNNPNWVEIIELG